jgi:hypothetical protein
MRLFDRIQSLTIGLYFLGRQSKYYYPAQEAGLPEVFGHMFMSAKQSIERGKNTRQSVETIECILDNLHPRHYERLYAEYEQLRKEYIVK